MVGETKSMAFLCVVNQDSKCPALLLAIEHSIGQSLANGSTTKLKIQSTPVIMAFFNDFANKKMEGSVNYATWH